MQSHPFIIPNSMTSPTPIPITTNITSNASEAALQLLAQTTGYTIRQENGQRKFGGPPPGWDKPEPPSRGCEIFIGKIPRDIYEDMLIPVFQRMGRIYVFRLMMDFSGSNRGYAFCTYCSRADAKRAIRELNNYEILKGRFLGVCSSVDNCRLFVGGIPKTKVKEEIFSEMAKVTEGVVDVIVYPSALDKSKNRGFAFIEYTSHRDAAMARRKLLIPGKINLWGNPVAVDWAEPEQETDEDVMEHVRILYVRNLMLSTTEEMIKARFEEAAGAKDSVERVKKMKDFAFVHFRVRSDALTAMKSIDGSILDGAKVEVVLAKPVDKNDTSRLAKNKVVPQITGTNGESPLTSYNFVVDQKSGPLRQIGIQVQSNHKGYTGTRSAGGTKSYTTTLNIQKHPVELLEDLCKKGNWGSPYYALHSAMQRDANSNIDCQLFLYKVRIPAFPSSNFEPTKLCRTVEEAKIYAAECTLLQLGVPIQSSDVSRITPPPDPRPLPQALVMPPQPTITNFHVPMATAVPPPQPPPPSYLVTNITAQDFPAFEYQPTPIYTGYQ